MKVYRKVKCSDRFPLEAGDYHTNKGLQTYYLWATLTFYSDTEYWLEAIELPSEEDIMSEENKQSTNEASIGFNNGVNYILNKLKSNND